MSQVRPHTLQKTRSNGRLSRTTWHSQRYRPITIRKPQHYLEERLMSGRSTKTTTQILTWARHIPMRNVIKWRAVVDRNEVKTKRKKQKKKLKKNKKKHKNGKKRNQKSCTKKTWKHKRTFNFQISCFQRLYYNYLSWTNDTNWSARSKMIATPDCAFWNYKIFHFFPPLLMSLKNTKVNNSLCLLLSNTLFGWVLFLCCTIINLLLIFHCGQTKN